MNINDIKLNDKNPRLIKDEKFKKLVASLKEFPMMTNLREVIIDENNVILGGNMRYRAAKEAGWKTITTKKFTREMADENNKLTNQNKTYEDYCDEIVIKDNISGGDWDWDILANEFDFGDLNKWGLDTPKEPEPNEELALLEKKELAIEFENDNDLEELYNELSERGYKCRILTL